MEKFKEHLLNDRRKHDEILSYKDFQDFLDTSGCQLCFLPYESDMFYLPDGSGICVDTFQDIESYIKTCLKAYDKWEEEHR